MGRHYSHLRLDERRRIAKWLVAKMPITEMADRLGRSASTLYRDIKRNRYTDTELPELADITLLRLKICTRNAARFIAR